MPIAPRDLPPRIWIVGPTGAGKSTLAVRLARRLGVEPTHLDDLYWEPGWVARSKEELRRRLEPIVLGPSWVVDGNYSIAQKGLIDRADLVVWLDLPHAVTFRRLLFRSFDRAIRKTPCCNGNREDLWGTLTRRDSILVWSLLTHRKVRRQYAARLANRPHVRFRDERQVNDWVAGLAVAAPAIAPHRNSETRAT